MFGYTTALNRSLAGNTSLRSLDIQTDMARQNVTLKKFAWIPTLAVTYNMNWNALSNGNPFKNQDFNPYSTVGLALQVPIFSGGSKYFGVKQAEVQLKEMEFQRENLVNSLNMQVELAIDNINRQVKQIHIALHLFQCDVRHHFDRRVHAHQHFQLQLALSHRNIRSKWVPTTCGTWGSLPPCR